MDDHRRADDENGETDDARAQMGRQRHRELGTGKEGERGVAVVAHSPLAGFEQARGLGSGLGLGSG